MDTWSVESDPLEEQFVNVLFHLSSFLNVQQPPKNENVSQMHYTSSLDLSFVQGENATLLNCSKGNIT